jgi:putative transposase
MGKLRNDWLNRIIFYSLKEARIVIEQCRHYYNHHRSHSALGAGTGAAHRDDDA